MTAATPAADMPTTCLLCGDSALELRFAARTPLEANASTYRCTSCGHRRHQPIWRCRACGLLTQWPRPPDDELTAAYEGVEDPLYVAERENRYLTFRRVVGKLGAPEGRSLLDVGAYCGYFVDVAGEAGFSAEGLELSSWAAAEARSLGLTVHSETLATRVSSGARYDVVTMWDVLEHLADPRKELEHVHSLLRPGGRLYLSTVDARSRLARVMGARWPWLMDMHLHYFDRATLPRLLGQAGFRVLDIGTYSYIVSARYFLEKTGASFRPLRAVTSALGAVTPPSWRVPINFGDNMFVTAERVP
jgi:SAM-dependent methyltransferase